MIILPHEETPHASPHSWESWVRVHGNKLLLFARQQARTMEDAEDILQEALVKLAQLEASGKFEGGQDAWLPYVYTALRRLAIDYSRRDDRRHKREAFVGEDIHTHEESQAWFTHDSDSRTLSTLLERELKNMPPKFAEVIIMRIWGELTFQQIADSLGTSLNTVASRYRYGIDSLRKSLQSIPNTF